MKIRIEGCTQEELAKWSAYLTLDKVYEATVLGDGMITFESDCGNPVEACWEGSAHLPKGAKWVEVEEAE